VKKVVIPIVIVVALVVIVGIAPLMNVPYQDTETYYEDEPYVVSEQYTEVEEQAVTQQKNAVLIDVLFVPWRTDTFPTYIDISGKSNCLVKGQFMPQLGSPKVGFYVYDDTDPSQNIGTPENPIVAIAPVSGYTFSFVPERSGTYYFRFECYGVIRTGFQFDVEWEWQETVVETEEVTKYRDVTKYRQVERQRTVTRYEKGSILEYLRARF